MVKRFATWIWALCFLGGTAQGPAQSISPGWGANPHEGGATFRVWAPGATSVCVAGTFNGWNTTAHPLALESATSGVWSADVPGALTNHGYKYVVNGSLWRSDPRSRIIDSAHNDNSVIAPTNVFAWDGERVGITNAPDLVIYEAHVGTFPGAGGTFAAFGRRLGQLEELGATAVELMPINEFPTATSWGYNPTYPFAVERGYGTPEALKDFVQTAHGHGLAVLVDVVHNHWDGGSSLWAFDGTSPGPYFYGSDPYTYTAWGPRPDYERAEVREYIDDTFRAWLDDYHVDGFRWDAPKHIIYTTNGVFIPDGLRLVNDVLARLATNCVGVWNVAEDTKEIGGFDVHWDLTFAREIKSVLTQGADAQRDMPMVARNVAGPAARVVFTESHDTTGDLNGGVRLPTAIDGANPESYCARKRAQLGLTLVMTSPGTPMVWQGQEWLETNSFSSARALDWTRTNHLAGHWALCRDLIRLRRNLDGVSAGLQGDSVSVYQVDDVNKLIVYSRWDGSRTGAPVVVVANFANAVRSDYPVQFPAAGAWYALFNGDSADYADDYGDVGSREAAAAGEPATAPVTIGPYSALIFSQVPRTGMVVVGTEVADRPAGNGNGALDPGETIREHVALWNKSSRIASNVVATLATSSPGVTLTQDRAAYGSLDPDGSATNAAAFEYRLDPELACGSALRFELVAAFDGQALTGVFEHVVGQTASRPPQTNRFASADVPKPIADATTTYSDLAIDQAGAPVVRDVDVDVRIDHTCDKDLILALQHPDGSEVLLAYRRGGRSADYGAGACGSGTNATFDQSAAQSITNASAPFAGRQRPEGSLDAFNGKPLNGTWRLRMADVYGKNAGTNLCWSLEIVYAETTCAAAVFSNRPPTAQSTNLQVAVAVDFALAGADEDGQDLTFAVRKEAEHGMFALHAPATGAATYVPVHGYRGTDSVEFAVSDGVATSAPATATFVMPPPADANANGLPDDWEWAHWTNLVAARPDADDDGDGASNLQEYRANTDPRDDRSVLRLHALEFGAEPILRWAAVGGTRYRVERSADERWTNYVPVERPLAVEVDSAPVGESSVHSFADETAATNRASAYRVRVLDR